MIRNGSTSDKNCARRCNPSHSRSTRRSRPASRGAVALNQSANYGCEQLQKIYSKRPSDKLAEVRTDKK